MFSILTGRVFFCNFSLDSNMEKELHNISPAPDTVIVIGRQFGSGGRRIGRLVAERLGVPYYDKELLSHAAKSLGFSPDVFAAADEKRPSAFHTLLQSMYGIADNFHTTSISGERLYEQQSKVIREICSKGSCVIVGRTADYVMRDHPGLVSVFLHAPVKWRAEKIVRRGEAMCCENAIEQAQKHDRNRENYYNYYTSGHWGRADNYHLCLNSSLLSESRIADLIIEFARDKRRDGINMAET